MKSRTIYVLLLAFLLVPDVFTQTPTNWKISIKQADPNSFDSMYPTTWISIKPRESPIFTFAIRYKKASTINDSKLDVYLSVKNESGKLPIYFSTYLDVDCKFDTNVPISMRWSDGANSDFSIMFHPKPSQILQQLISAKTMQIRFKYFSGTKQAILTFDVDNLKEFLETNSISYEELLQVANK